MIAVRIAATASRLVEDAAFIVLAQAFGAAVQGIGLAALRLRTNTI